MKKTQKKNLALSKEMVRTLDKGLLAAAAGGSDTFVHCSHSAATNCTVYTQITCTQ